MLPHHLENDVSDEEGSEDHAPLRLAPSELCRHEDDGDGDADAQRVHHQEAQEAHQGEDVAVAQPGEQGRVGHGRGGGGVRLGCRGGRRRGGLILC